MEKLFLEYKDLAAFRNSLQDFLVQIKVRVWCRVRLRLCARAHVKARSVAVKRRVWVGVCAVGACVCAHEGMV